MYLEIKLENATNISFFVKVISETELYYHINEIPNLNIRARFNLKAPRKSNIVRIHKANKNAREHIILIKVVQKIPDEIEEYRIYE